MRFSSSSAAASSSTPLVAARASGDISRVYDAVRSQYTHSDQVVPDFNGSNSNLSQASLNRQMLQMLELRRGLSVADLGSGCGLTTTTFIAFGCAPVVGIEFHAKSVRVAELMSSRTLAMCGLDARPQFINGAVNDVLTTGAYDRLHGGYMMSHGNAERYVRKNLKAGGLAVLNVGNRNIGDVVIYRKDASGGVTARNTGLQVIFQRDAKP